MARTLDEIKATLTTENLATVDNLAAAIRADLARRPQPLPATPKPRRRDIDGHCAGYAFDVVN